MSSLLRYWTVSNADHYSRTRVLLRMPCDSAEVVTRDQMESSTIRGGSRAGRSARSLGTQPASS